MNFAIAGLQSRILRRAVGCMAIAVAPAAAAQDTGAINGTVAESASGRPLAGVQVFVGGTRLVAVTDDSGSYFIDDVPAGPLIVSARLIGYEVQRTTITVLAGQTGEVNFGLTISVIRLDEILVTRRGARRGGYEGYFPIFALAIVLSTLGIFAGLELWPAHVRRRGHEPGLRSKLAGMTLGAFLGGIAGAGVLSVYFESLDVRSITDGAVWWWLALVTLSGVGVADRLPRNARFAVAVGAGVIGAVLWRTLVAFSLIPEAVGFTATFYNSWPFTFIAGLIWGLAVGLREVLPEPYGVCTDLQARSRRQVRH